MMFLLQHNSFTVPLCLIKKKIYPRFPLCCRMQILTSYLKSCRKRCRFEIPVTLFHAIVAFAFCGFNCVCSVVPREQKCKRRRRATVWGISCTATSLRRAASCIPGFEFASQRELNDFTRGSKNAGAKADD